MGKALLAGRTVLVAGGTGNVGTHLTRELLRAGARVVVPSRSAGKLAKLKGALGKRLEKRVIGLEGRRGRPERFRAHDRFRRSAGATRRSGIR